MIRATWTLPLVLALATLLGLIAALAGDGAVDLLASAALSLPIIAALWAFRVQRR